LGWFWAWGWGGIRPWGWISRSGRRRRATALARVALILASAGLIVAVGAAQPPGKEPERPQTKAPPPSPAPGTTKSARQAVSQGRTAYEKGQMEEALADFESAVRAAPTAAVPRYNSAAALFQLGRFDEARSRYTEARALADAAMCTKIDYALGNTALAMGDVPGAIEAYTACIASTARGADLDVVRKDAEINRAYAYEKAQSPAIPKGPDDPSPSRRPDGRRSPDRNPGGDDPSADGNEESGPSTEGDNPADDADQKGRDRARRRRRPGGSGTGRTTPPGASGESPDDRLDAAIDSIRAAQSRRLPDEPPPPSTGSDGRDW
jgi:Ca-activated chloride channel family protein